MERKSNILSKASFLFGLIFVFSSCSKRLDKIQYSNQSNFTPTSVAQNINTKYTDSGRLTTVLLSPKMVNFSNQEFPYYEFPDGINLTLYDRSNKSSTVKSKHAIIYNETDLIDLRGDVVLITSKNDTLFTDQLYYDQKKEWLFTDLPVKFRTKNYLTNGNGFDANQDFTNAQVLEVTGRIYIEE